MVGYGTNQASNNRTASAAEVESGQETRPLLGNGIGSKSNAETASSRLHAYCNVNVSSTWGDLALLFCYIITGLLDSSSVYTWGSFV